VNPAVLVPIKEIIVDDRLQPRQDGLADDHIAALMETPEAWPPVILAQLEVGKYLIDGFHRHEAARQLGLGEISASIYAPAPGTDLLGVAFQLNAKHGRPLTLRDRKAYAVTLLARHPDLADREIGRHCGLHHETVGALRNQQSRILVPQRKPGELKSDVGLLDPIRWAKKATKEQKSIAGYVARLKTALSDPYEEGSTVDEWPSQAAEVARACIVAMGAKRAAETFESIANDAIFMLDVADAASDMLKEAS
jgi:hypothetical protein